MTAVPFAPEHAGSAIHEVLVVGHHDPDTDAVCSALAYAPFYAWQTGEKAVACHLDELNRETAWLLTHLGLPAPRAIKDVYLRVRDVMLTDVSQLRPDQTLREGGLVMQGHGLDALPVVDSEGRYTAMMARGKLADRYLAELQLPRRVELPLALLRRTLEAELVVGEDAVVVRGRVCIATFSESHVQERVGLGDLVIVGDQSDVQRAAVSAGAGCLVATDGASICRDAQAGARAGGAVILRTRKSTFAAARLIQQSLPLTCAMDENSPRIGADDRLTDGFELLRQHHLAALPVVDRDETYRGLLLRRHLAGQGRRRVILTDHNHADQAAAGVSESEILAIIDHHNLGGLRTLTPLRMQVEPLGCTCTLIAEEYRRHRAPLPPPLAGAMLGAILSDTVEFRSPTTTKRDRKAARWLAEKAGEDMGVLARALFRARLPRPVPPPRWWVHHDWKIYRFSGQEIGIGQTELTEIEKSMPSVEALRRELRTSVKASGLYMAFLVMTDILEERSFLLAHDERSLGLASHAFRISPDDSGLLALPGVMSRKKQVVPVVAAALKEMSAAA
jgi:manganese-dependent inorganic pyrophosphatase